MDFRRGLVTGTVRERVDRNDLAPLAIPERVVEGIQLAVDCPVSVPLLNPLFAPVAVLVAGGIGNDFNGDRIPKLEQGVAMALFVGERDWGSGLEVSVEVTGSLVFADHVRNRAGHGLGLLRFRVRALPLRFRPPAPVVFLASQLEVFLGSEIHTKTSPGSPTGDGWPFVIGAVGRVSINAGLDVYVSLLFLCVCVFFSFHVVHCLHNGSSVTLRTVLN